MYGYIVRTAAALWAGTDPDEVRLNVRGKTNEYLRGQVELIVDMGITPKSHAEVAEDIRNVVAREDRTWKTSYGHLIK